MTIFYFSLEEWWPVLCLDESDKYVRASSEERKIELSADEVADLRRVNAEFSAWQEKLRAKAKRKLNEWNSEEFSIITPEDALPHTHPNGEQA